MKNISAKKYAIALYELVKDADEEKTKELLKSFMRTVIANKDMNKMDKIIRAFSEYYNDLNNTLEIKLTTAESVTEQLGHIQQKLKESFGKDIELKEKIDPNIIGGIILQYGDNVADGSIRKKVANLADSLK